MAPLPATMKAVEISKNGGTEVLDYKDVAVPSLSDNQVLVRNHFSGVNFIDTYFRTGLYPTQSFPLILGREASGEIVAAHDSVSDGAFKPGTRVAYLSTSAYAEYSAVDVSNVVAIPEGISSEAAAAILLQGLTAWTFIKEAANVRAGQWVLVHAAAGGTGLLLVQMLRTIGANIIATASTQEKLALASKHGAHHTISSRDDAEVIVAKVKEITGGHGVDVIFDGVGKATFDADLDMIALKGHLICFGNASGAVAPLNILRLGAKNVKLMRPVLFGYISTRGELDKYSKELFDLVLSSKVEVNIHEIYSLKDVARAHSDLEGRKSTGKLLLKID